MCFPNIILPYCSQNIHGLKQDLEGMLLFVFLNFLDSEQVVVDMWLWMFGLNTCKEYFERKMCNLVSVFAEPVPHPKLLGQLSQADNFCGELKNPEEPECLDQKII